MSFKLFLCVNQNKLLFSNSNRFAHFVTHLLTYIRLIVFYDYLKHLHNDIIFSVDDVFHGLSALRSVESIGPDCLSGEFLFQLRYIISYPLFLLFMRSLDKGMFPSIIQFSFITPILKSSNAADISNYRPINILIYICDHLIS